MESIKLLTVEDKYKKVIYSLPLPIAEEIYPNFIIYHKALKLRKKYRWTLIFFFVCIILFMLTALTMIVSPAFLKYGVPSKIFFPVSVVILSFLFYGCIVFRLKNRSTHWKQIREGYKRMKV